MSQFDWPIAKKKKKKVETRKAPKIKEILWKDI
jgi:hypothetical protein